MMAVSVYSHLVWILAIEMFCSGPSEVIFVSGKQTQWLDYVPSPVIALAATSVFCAVALADGSLNAYSHTGRKSAPVLMTVAN